MAAERASRRLREAALAGCATPARVGTRSVVRWDYALAGSWARAWHVEYVLVLGPVAGGG